MSRRSQDNCWLSDGGENFVTWEVVVGTGGTWEEGLGEINATVLMCVFGGVWLG